MPETLSGQSKGWARRSIFAPFAKVLLGSRFVLMPANKTQEPQVRSSTELAIFDASSRTTFALAATALEGSSIAGTVDSEPVPVEGQLGRITAGALTIGRPFDSTADPAARGPQPSIGPRTNDLISELREISSQVNRIMAQVERAIDRLAVHAG